MRQHMVYSGGLNVYIYYSCMTYAAVAQCPTSFETSTIWILQFSLIKEFS